MGKKLKSIQKISQPTEDIVDIHSIKDAIKLFIIV